MGEKTVYAKRLDTIENQVFQECLKPRGFRKYGRTLNRVVDGDLVQIVQFRGGNTIRQDNDRFQVLFSLRVPECTERTLTPKPLKKSGYQEQDANFRMNELGTLENRPADTFAYPLYEGCEDHYVHKIADALERLILPVFDDLDSREKFLANRSRYAAMEWLCRADFDAALILGRLGRIAEAAVRFQQYYDDGVRKDRALAHRGDMTREMLLVRKQNMEALAEQLGLPLRKSRWCASRIWGHWQNN